MRPLPPIALLLLCCASCQSEEERLWHTSAKVAVAPGVYLCKDALPGEGAGFTDPATARAYYLSRTTFLSLANVDTVYPARLDGYGDGLTLQWSERGAQQFSAFGAQCYGRTIAIVCGNAIVMAARIESSGAGRKLTLHGPGPGQYARCLQDGVRAARTKGE